VSFFRKLFSRRTEPADPPASPSPGPVALAAAGAWTPRPEPARAETRVFPQEECVDFPLKAITDLFGDELKAALRKQPSEHVQVHIPRALIQPQLAAGAVRITFAQLREVTPEIFFHAEAAPAGAKVQLPMEIVLQQMMPARRQGQRQPAAPMNIPSIFVKAEAARTNGGVPRVSADPWYTPRRPTYEAPPEPQPAQPQPAAAPDAAAPDAPAADAPAANKKHFQPLAAVTERTRRAPEAAAAAPSTPPGMFALPLAGVLAALPGEVRHALNGSEAQTALFFVPIGEIERRLRTGKLLFKWGQLRDWCNASLSALAAPELDMLDIELPLAAVVPLFMAAREAQDPRKQVEIDARIPDIFARSKAATPHPAPPAPAPALAPAPAEPPAMRLEKMPEPAKPEPLPTAGAPAQIVGRLRALDGVTGSFIATADGLLVAGDVPNANENVLAAFAPTVFAQLTKYADMARLGLPESVDINLGGDLVHVRKAGNLYLGVLMSGGHPPPLAELARISKALQPHTV
jgi:predicted regulator of Ras-like GTPase activity (Roadblock/LC7/MglB family)